MGWKLNTVLALAVGGGAFYLYKSTGERPEAPSGDGLTRKLLPKNVWEARQIKVQIGNQEPMILALDAANEQFRISDPVDDVASMAMLKSLCDTYGTAHLLVGFTAEELAKDPQLVQKCGFDTPRAKVEVRFADQAVKLEIGLNGHRSDELYVRLDGKIFIGSKALFSAIQHNPDEFRERVLFTHLAVGEVQRLRLERKVDGKPVADAIQRQPNGWFGIVEPAHLRADQKMVDGLVREAGSLQVARFLSGSVEKFEKVDLTLSISGSRGMETLDLKRLGDGKGGNAPVLLGHLRQRNIVFEVPAGPIARLEWWARLLRAKHLLEVDREQITRIELDPGVGQQPCVLARPGSRDFRLERPVVSEQVSPTPLSKLLDALVKLEAREFLEQVPADSGLADGQGYFTVRVTVHGQLGPPAAIRFGRTRTDGLVFARREGDQAAVLLPQEVVADVRQPWIDFVHRRFLKLDALPFRLEIDVPGKPRRVLVNKGGWHDEAGAEVADVADFAAWMKLLDADDVVKMPSPAAPAVHVLARRDVHQQSGVLAEFDLRPLGKHVLVTTGRDAPFGYVVRKEVFRRLLDRWSK